MHVFNITYMYWSLCNVLNTKKPSKFTLLQRRKPNIVDESNHNGAEQESLLKQERFVQMEITFTLRKNGGYMPSDLGDT